MATILLSMGAIALLITVLVCIVKMNHEIEELHDAVRAIGRSISQLKRDSQVDSSEGPRTVRGEVRRDRLSSIASANSKPKHRPRAKKRPTRPVRNSAPLRRRRRDEELPVEDASVFLEEAEPFLEEGEPIRQRRPRPTGQDQQLDSLAAQSKREFERAMLNKLDFETDDVEFESGDKDDEEPSDVKRPLPSLPQPPEPKAATNFLNAAAADEPPSDNIQDDDIVVDDGDDEEIVYI